MDRQKERRGGNERKHLQSTLDLVWKSDFISKTAFDLSIRPRERGHETIARWILPRSGFEHLILKAGKALVNWRRCTMRACRSVKHVAGTQLDSTAQELHAFGHL